MDFYLDMDLQGVTERTRDQDIQEFEHVVHEEFVNRLKKAFPEGDFRCTPSNSTLRGNRIPRPHSVERRFCTIERETS